MVQKAGRNLCGILVGGWHFLELELSLEHVLWSLALMCTFSKGLWVFMSSENKSWVWLTWWCRKWAEICVEFWWVADIFLSLDGLSLEHVLWSLALVYIFFEGLWVFISSENKSWLDGAENEQKFVWNSGRWLKFSQVWIEPRICALEFDTCVYIFWSSLDIHELRE
jgi:hypothetical protein